MPFSIPFRSLYSKNVDNLLMAGRNISASHLGMSNTRVMLTCAILGHAAGTGAAFCVQENTSPRGVYQNHMAALQQQLLKEGAAVLDLKADDPRDLAPQAAATASSERTHTSGERMAATNVINGFARAVGERMKETTNAWGPDPKARRSPLGSAHLARTGHVQRGPRQLSDGRHGTWPVRRRGQAPTATSGPSSKSTGIATGGTCWGSIRSPRRRFASCSTSRRQSVRYASMKSRSALSKPPAARTATCGCRTKGRFFPGETSRNVVGASTRGNCPVS